MLSDRGVSPQLITAIYSSMGATVILGRVTTGYLVDRFPAPIVAGCVLWLPVIGCVLLATGSKTPVTLFVAATTFGLAGGAELDLMPYLAARMFGLKAYGRILGWLFAMFYAGNGVGPLVVARINESALGYRGALYACVPLLLLGTAAIALLPRRAGDPASSQAALADA